MVIKSLWVLWTLCISFFWDKGVVKFVNFRPHSFWCNIYVYIQNNINYGIINYINTGILLYYIISGMIYYNIKYIMYTISYKYSNINKDHLFHNL